MNEEYNKLINRLNENIHRLILLYNESVEENKKIKTELNNKTEKITLLERELSDLKTKYEKLKLVKTIEGTISETGDAKQKLNRIIREIDNCIALLNK
jgi:septal ring factor EnvC (AmiA/AmiB activator)